MLYVDKCLTLTCHYHTQKCSAKEMTRHSKIIKKIQAESNDTYFIHHSTMSTASSDFVISWFHLSLFYKRSIPKHTKCWTVTLSLLQHPSVDENLRILRQVSHFALKIQQDKPSLKKFSWRKYWSLTSQIKSLVGGKQT